MFLNYCSTLHMYANFTIYYAGSIPPFQPIVLDTATEPTSATISWIVANISFDHENYIVMYGTERAVLQNTSEVVVGNRNVLVTNDAFNVTITGLIPFTTYYYILLANNSIGNTSSNLMNFTTNETGT